MNKECPGRKISVLYKNELANVWHEDFEWVDPSWTDQQINDYLASWEYDVLIDYGDEEDIEECMGNTDISWHDAE